jgi:hypothetical protein
MHCVTGGANQVNATHALVPTQFWFVRSNVYITLILVILRFVFYSHSCKLILEITFAHHIQISSVSSNSLIQAIKLP